MTKATGYARLVEIITETTKATRKVADRPEAIADAIADELPELLGAITVYVADPKLTATDVVEIAAGVEVQYHGTRPVAWHFPAAAVVAIESSEIGGE